MKRTKAHVLGTGRHWLIVTVAPGTQPGTPRFGDSSGEIVEEDPKRGGQHWCGVAIRVRGNAVCVGHSGSPWHNHWVWRRRWRRLRHPFQSRRPQVPMGTAGSSS